MRTKEPMVGVFMPAYNQGKYIDDAIESLKEQIFQDFVVHIVDDGSDDEKTLEKLKSIEYDKAKVYLNSDNRGVAFRAREHYKMFTTKYIMVLCADDKLAPEFLEKTVEFLENNPEYGAVSTDMLEYMDSFSGEPFANFHYDPKKMGLPDMLSECHCLGSSLMRNKALKETDLSGGFTRYQDWDRWISMLEIGWKIGLVSEPLFMYRLHMNSLSHSSSAEIETEVFEKIMKKHKNLYKKYDMEIIKALFSKFQGSGFFNKALSRDYLSLEKQNIELKKQIEEISSSRVIKIYKKIKGFLKY